MRQILMVIIQTFKLKTPKIGSTNMTLFDKLSEYTVILQTKQEISVLFTGFTPKGKTQVLHVS